MLRLMPAFADGGQRLLQGARTAVEVGTPQVRRIMISGLVLLLRYVGINLNATLSGNSQLGNLDLHPNAR